MMSRWLTFGLVFATGAALALRLPHLEQRPMHNDEAVNAIKFGQLWQHGSYRYDPNEHHGPTLYYATYLMGSVTGPRSFEDFSEARFRALTVLFGLGLVLLVPLLADGLGRGATIWAGIFAAISPALVFYSRYYIHEILLVFFTFLAMAAGWRYWRTRKLSWALLCGAAMGLMHATKETFVITLAAAALALGLNHTWNRVLDASGQSIRAVRLNPWHLAAGLGVWILVWASLFTSFFTNFAGLLDSFRTYKFWLSRAGGESSHVHPWSFYLHRLIFFHLDKGPLWSEALLALLACVGAWAAFARKGLAGANASFVRFLALYTLSLTAAYSLISYKTPWCLLSFWHGMILLAGVGAIVLVSRATHQLVRAGVMICLVAASGQLAAQAWQASVPYASDWRNPYVYAQTSTDVLNLVDTVEALAEAHPQGHQMLVKVMAPDNDYWPLPWYLRRFKQVGWWSEVPPDPFAPVMIVSSKLKAGLDEKKTHLMVGYTQLRPATFFELYVELNLWRAYLARKHTSPQNP